MLMVQHDKILKVFKMLSADYPESTEERHLNVAKEVKLDLNCAE